MSLSSRYVFINYVAYTTIVPKLWSETIESHRREVHDAIMETTASLVGERGLRAVTMSQIADDVGIGRATLYKYFPDVESILLAWHERHVSRHLDQLAELRASTGDVAAALHAVLDAYALILHEMSHQGHGTELIGLLHQGPHVAQASERLSEFLRDLIADGAKMGSLRDDVGPDELASYCIHALRAAGSLPSTAAVHRLVGVTLAGMHRTPDNPQASPA